MEDPNASTQPAYLRVGAVKRWVSSKRKYSINLSATFETKVRIREAAGKLYMNQSEFIEWLMDKYAHGHVIVTEEGAFMEGLVKTMDDRAERVAKESAERQVLAILYDKGLVDSPFRK